MNRQSHLIEVALLEDALGPMTDDSGEVCSWKWKGQHYILHICFQEYSNHYEVSYVSSSTDHRTLRNKVCKTFSDVMAFVLKDSFRNILTKAGAILPEIES